MRIGKITKICIAACIMLGLTITPINQLKVHAEESFATVTGSILSGTTAELLLLSTKDGKMEIKLDSGTDTSACKLLLTGKNINVSVSHGSDEYLHATKITSAAPTTTAAAPTNAATVSGTLGEKTTEAILYLNTAQGEMQIKFDTTTNMSGCAVLVMGKTYYVTCTRGADAYMHAISISDQAATAAVPPALNNIAAQSVTGTVASGTKEGLLYLSTDGGEMQLVIDSNSDTSKGMVLTTGNKLTVSFYRGSDAHLHAAVIAGVKDSPAAVEINTSSTATVSGSVESGSTENILYLKTPQGRMELKLDAVSSMNCKALINGKKVTVTCARGADAYMHALTISAN